MRDTDQLLPEPPANDRPGDRYICTFSGAKPPCVGGPGRWRRCPAAGACRVRMSAWYRQRLLGICCTAATLLLLAAALAGPWRAEVLAPGELSQSHAQILSGELHSDRCAACHPAAAGEGLVDWFSAGQTAHDGVHMTDRCMDCHHVKFDRALARSPHNLAAEELRQKTRLVNSRDKSWHDMLPGAASESLECSVCHREHHGPAHDLRHISNQQCQACHADRFASFQDGHPEFDDWPYQAGEAAIRFSHAAHAREHYAKRNQSFDCATCHSLHADGQTMETAPFDAACASCHAQPLDTAIDGGFALLEFPRLPDGVVDAAGLDRWPLQARGPASGSLPPLTRLLLRQNPEVARALGRLPGGEWDRLDLQPNSPERHDVQTVAKGLVQLADAIGREGQAVVMERLQRSGVEEGAAQALIREFPVALAADAISYAWQRNATASRNALHNAPLLRLASASSGGAEQSDGGRLVDPQQPDAGSELPLGDAATDSLLDPLGDPLSDPLVELLGSGPSGAKDALGDLPASLSTDARRLLPTGGWYRDDVRMAIRYRPAGHADSRLVALVELALHSAVDARVRESVAGLPAVQACLECHQPAGRHSRPMLWTAAPVREGFTRFAHGPHMNISQIRSCTHCHQMSEPEASVRSVSGGQPHSDFASMKRFQCAVCHKPEAAGDNCTQCHRYHATLRN